MFDVRKLDEYHSSYDKKVFNEKYPKLSEFKVVTSVKQYSDTLSSSERDALMGHDSISADFKQWLRPRTGEQ